MSKSALAWTPIRATAKECFAHYRKEFLRRHPPNSKGAVEAKWPMADFCGVNVPAIQRWFTGSGEAIGLTQFKLICFLSLHGYQVIEHERRKQAHKGFAELLGFGLLTPKEAQTLLGYSDLSSIYNVLRGNEGVSEDKEHILWETWKARREELEAAKRAAQTRLGIEPSGVPTASLEEDEMRRDQAPAPVPAQPVLEAVVVPGKKRLAAVFVLLASVDALLKELSPIDVSKLTPAERVEAQRILVGMGATLNTLNTQLLGETSSNHE
ncbi:MAG: hypothetical protein Q8P82_00310 [bacterium]|nr:hypothetical protein [bacterium]